MTSAGCRAVAGAALVALAIVTAPSWAWTQESARTQPPSDEAASLDRQKSFVRKQELQSDVKELEQRWQRAGPDARRSDKARDPSSNVPSVRSDDRAVFDALQRSRSELDRVTREGQR